MGDFILVNKMFQIEKRKIGKNYLFNYPEIESIIMDIDVAFKMVDAAKKAGAEIVKHQTHIP